ncbi:MAG: nucleotidyl transferase AbiEii/AbiGii toxin family protein [Acidobacteria bacterium]|nr:nucleotidyl transferase AbiEii/AbiGii toxin family protein [Acidobacteriota bacterium]
MKKRAANAAASIRAKLLNVSRTAKQEFQFVLDRWAAERFLYRLGRSPLRESFVLKGATLFLIWRGALPRRTRDIGLLAYGSSDPRRILESARSICAVHADDGILFDIDNITVAEIRENSEYDGLRMRVPASLDKAKTVLQIDIGFGDVVSPGAENRELPAMLGLDAPNLRIYPPETVIAEKFQAMVQLDMPNSRMKDFFDIWLLSREQPFQIDRLAGALKATFARRKTELPRGRPVALTGRFLRDELKVAQWREFLVRVDLPLSVGELADVGESIAKFLMPVVESIHAEETLDLYWPTKGPWRRARQ